MRSAKQQVVLQQEKAVLVYDAACPVCANAVAWIAANEREGSFELLPCQSETLAARFPFLDRTDCMQAMHLVLPGNAVLQGDQALPEILKRSRRYRMLAFLFRLPGSRTLSRLLYRWFAEHRYAIAHLFRLSLPKNK